MGSARRAPVAVADSAPKLDAAHESPLERARSIARDAYFSGYGADPDHAVEACDHALSLLLPVGPSEALADVLRWKGSILRDRGNHTVAADLYAQSLAVADAQGYRNGRAHVLNCLGTIAQIRGDLAAAERWFGEAARLAHRLSDRTLSGMVQQNLGIVADVQGRTDEAVAHFRLSLVAFEQEDQLGPMLSVMNNLGVLYTRERSFRRAEESLDRALSLARRLGDVVHEGIIEENRSALFLALGNTEKAEGSAAAALRIAEQRKDNTRRAAALRCLARVAIRRSPAEAISLLERALSLAELGEDALLRAETLAALGDAYQAAHQLMRARESWRRALDIARIAGFGGLIPLLQARLRPSQTEGGDTAAVAP
jgi:tetratricopeptide (TPR) repeat protein